MTPRTKRLMASATVLAAAAAMTATLALAGLPEETVPVAAPPLLAESGQPQQRALDSVETYSATATRPLFSPSRRPEPPPAAPVAAVSPPPPAPVAPPPPGTLLGILISPQGSAAIIRQTGGHSETVPEGGSFQGWLVKQVLPDRVLLLLGTTSTEVTFPVSQPQASGARPASQPLLPLRRRG